VANLVLAFAGLSLLLAAVGLYGVLSYLGTQRVSEIGIRIAVGARPLQILPLVLFDGLRPALLGIILGLTATMGATPLLRSMLYGTGTYDPAVIAAVVLTLLAIASIACIFPASRFASRSDAGIANGNRAKSLVDGRCSPKTLPQVTGQQSVMGDICIFPMEGFRAR
jgi:macrolide transport system ATP-binding/permease protein